MIDRDTIDKIMEATNIVDVVSEFVTLRKAGINYKGLCPFHDDKTPSFMVSPTKGICHCFACGKGGNAVNIFEVEYATPEIPEKTAADTVQIAPADADGAAEVAAGGNAQQAGKSGLPRFLAYLGISADKSGSGFPYLPVAIGAGVVAVAVGAHVLKHRARS